MIFWLATNASRVVTRRNITAGGGTGGRTHSGTGGGINDADHALLSFYSTSTPLPSNRTYQQICCIIMESRLIDARLCFNDVDESKGDKKPS